LQLPSLVPRNALPGPRTQKQGECQTAKSRGHLQHPTLLDGQALLEPVHRHRTLVSVSRVGCFRQFGRASTPRMPQRVHTMRGPNVGTGTSSGQLSALSTASRWHGWHDTAIDRTPLARMLPSVIGGPLMPRGYRVGGSVGKLPGVAAANCGGLSVMSWGPVKRRRRC
jgi:hypothetical protein